MTLVNPETLSTRPTLTWPTTSVARCFNARTVASAVVAWLTTVAKGRRDLPPLPRQHLRDLAASRITLPSATWPPAGSRDPPRPGRQPDHATCETV